MTKVPQTRDELETHVADQLRFLEALASSFDSGFDGEAKRMALAIRVLVSDTKNATSLLTALGRKNVHYFDSARAVEDWNMVGHSGLTLIKIGGRGAWHAPRLDTFES